MSVDDAVSACLFHPLSNESAQFRSGEAALDAIPPDEVERKWVPLGKTSPRCEGGVQSEDYSSPPGLPHREMLPRSSALPRPIERQEGAVPKGVAPRQAGAQRKPSLAACGVAPGARWGSRRTGSTLASIQAPANNAGPAGSLSTAV